MRSGISQGSRRINKEYRFELLGIYEMSREKQGHNVDRLSVCPAYPLNGKNCANVVGTFCDLVQALEVSMHCNCQQCPFYNSMHFDSYSRKSNQDDPTIRKSASL